MQCEYLLALKRIVVDVSAMPGMCHHSIKSDQLSAGFTSVKVRRGFSLIHHFSTCTICMIVCSLDWHVFVTTLPLPFTSPPPLLLSYPLASHH